MAISGQQEIEKTGKKGFLTHTLRGMDWCA